MSSGFQSRYDGLTPDEIAASLGESITEALHIRYGPAPDPAIVRRVQEEWAAMENGEEIEDVAALYEFTLWLKEQREPYWMRGTVGSSFILCLLGVTTGNPLPPHYYCPQCLSVIWKTTCADGFDLAPDHICEKDGTLLRGDGHNIPWQMLWRYGMKETAYELDIAEPLTEAAWAFFQGHWLTKLRPGVEITHRHQDGNPRYMKFSHLCINCHLDPGEINSDFYGITPDASCIPNARKVLAAHLEIQDDLDANLRSRPAHTFADVLTKYGLVHSTGVWDKDTRFMLDRLGYSLSDMIAYRDDVFYYLLSHGFSEEDATEGMYHVWTGRGLPVVTDEMSLARDKWAMSRCNKIVYVYSKAHAVEYIFYRLRAEGLRSDFTTSYEALSAALQLDQGSKVVLLGGRPGMGKSTFAKYFAERLSTVSGKKAMILMQERMNQKIRIDLIRNYINASRPDFIILDYLQSITDFNCATGEGSGEMVAFMAGIRAISDETGVSFLVISGVDRKTGRRKNRRPKIENLFCSADIAPYADGIIFLYREGYYDQDADQKQAVCVIAKSPGGTTGEIPLFWDDKNIAFDDRYVMALN